VAGKCDYRRFGRQWDRRPPGPRGGRAAAAIRWRRPAVAL